MRRNSTHSQEKLRNKGKQNKILLQAFFDYPKSMLHVEKETGISRSSITRYVSNWEKEGRIKAIYVGICWISKYTNVKFYSTNPIYFDKTFVDISHLTKSQRSSWFNALKKINSVESPASVEELRVLFQDVTKNRSDE